MAYMDPMGYDHHISDIMGHYAQITMQQCFMVSPFHPPQASGEMMRNKQQAPPAMGYNWSPQTSIFHDETLICFTQIKTKKMEHPEIASGS